MSGPPYPHPNPRPGSNAIGSFVIGVSPIGTIPFFDVWQTVLSQYANSTALTGMITRLNAALDQTQNFDDFYDLIWNVSTAQGYGLDVWGRIVGVSRTLHVPNADEYFGFAEAGDANPFNVESFFVGDPLTDNFNLSDAAFRTLIMAKAMSNITDDSIPSVNQLLLNLFPGRGRCYVTDGLNMTMTYTFEFALSDSEVAILQATDVLPTPAGVESTLVINPLL